MKQVNKRDYHTQEISGGEVVRCSAINSTLMQEAVMERYGMTQSTDAGIFSCSAKGIEHLEATYRLPGTAAQPIGLSQIIEGEFPTWAGKYLVNSRMPLIFDVTVHLPAADPEQFSFETVYNEST